LKRVCVCVVVDPPPSPHPITHTHTHTHARTHAHTHAHTHTHTHTRTHPPPPPHTHTPTPTLLDSSYNHPPPPPFTSLSFKVEMPSFSACVSSKCGGAPAQLSRLYVVTPSKHTDVTLDPRLRLTQGGTSAPPRVSVAMVAGGGAGGVHLDPGTFYVVMLPRAVTTTPPTAMTLLPDPIQFA
jgi:hypothetical protein